MPHQLVLHSARARHRHLQGLECHRDEAEKDAGPAQPGRPSGTPALGKGPDGVATPRPASSLQLLRLLCAHGSATA